jgi:hypothetical protein
MPTPKMPLWRTGYFEQKTTEKQQVQVQHSVPDFHLKQDIYFPLRKVPPIQ